MKKFFMLIAMLIFCGMQASAGDIYVSSDRGNDAADGSSNAPLLTISRALKQAREWRRLKLPEADGGIRIILDGGTYRHFAPIFVRPEDSGTVQSPTVICGANGGAKPVISGGMEVTGWKRGCDDPRLPAHVRNKVWVAEAPLLGNRIVETRQMYVDGVKARRASQFSDGVMERMKDFNAEDETITIPTPKFDLKSAKQLEMVVHQRWAIAILRVKSMTDDGNGNTVVRFHDPESRLEFAHPWPQPVIGGERGNSSFFLSLIHI